MRPAIPLLILGAISCTSSQVASPADPPPAIYRSYRALDGASNVHSTLVEQTSHDHHTLRGHTQLEDGAWLMEQATLDNQGRLLRAEFDRGGPCAHHLTHVTVDAQQGRIEINTAGIYTRWSVPTDLPWVLVGLITSEASGRDLATPVSMTIALRSAKTERATRLVDIEHFTSATIMSDQMLVDDAEPTVVLGDDYAEIEGDLPLRVHLAALGRDLDSHDPDLTAAWARLRCKNPHEGTAL